MKSEDANSIVFLTLIAGRKQKEELLTALSESDVHLITVIYGRGTVQANYLQNLLGLVPEVNKVVITGLTRQKNSDSIFRMLTEKFNFDKPNTGVAFITPVEKLSFK